MSERIECAVTVIPYRDDENDPYEDVFIPKQRANGAKNESGAE